MLAELISDPDGAVHVALDEGGLRCVWPSGAGYVPFAALVDVDLEKSFFGHTRLVLSGVHGEELRVRLENADALSVVGAIWREVTDRRAKGRSKTKLPSSLARAGRSLDEWLASLAGLAGRRGYREASPDFALLAEIFADELADVEARSAAAFLITAAGEPDELRSLARAFVGRALPPLVLVAARVAPGGPALVSDDVFTDLRALLPHEDREASASAAKAQARDVGREAEVSQALATATEAAAADAERARAAGEHRHGTKRLHLHGPGGTNNWVGRSWAL